MLHVADVIHNYYYIVSLVKREYATAGVSKRFCVKKFYAILKILNV